MKKYSEEIHPPYFLFALVATPIFLINFLLPAHPITPTHLSIAAFIDDHLFGQIGFWSSRFPLSSKLTANYIACIGPPFAIIAFYKTYQTMKIDPKQYDNYSLTKYVFVLIFMTFYLLFFSAIFYSISTDLAMNTRKYGFYGAYTFSFSLFSSSMLVIFYVTPIFMHRCFVYLPRLLHERWRLRRSQDRSQK